MVIVAGAVKEAPSVGLIMATVGGELVGNTTTEKLWNALSGGWPSSVTFTSKVLVPTCAGVGVQLNTPLAGSMLALGAALFPKLKVNTCGGLSGSLDRLVITRLIPS